MNSEVVSPGRGFPGTGVTSAFVPHDHPDSNYRMTRESMFTKAQVVSENIYPIPTDGTPDDAARRYEQTLQEAYGAPALDPQRPLFDVTLLGLGPDGHTASLLPGEPVLKDHFARRGSTIDRRGENALAQQRIDGSKRKQWCACRLRYDVPKDLRSRQ